MGFHQSSWFDQPKCSSREKPVQYQDSYLHWGIWAQLYNWLETLMLDVGQYCLSRPCPFKFLKAIFHKFYLVHSWILCAIWEFSEGSHWSDYPSVITEPEAKEEFLKRGKKVFFFCPNVNHVSRYCPKLKPGFYCKGTPGLTFCSKKRMREANLWLTEVLQLLHQVSLLSAPEIHLINPVKKQEVRVSDLFYWDLQRMLPNATQKMK